MGELSSVQSYCSEETRDDSSGHLVDGRNHQRRIHSHVFCNFFSFKSCFPQAGTLTLYISVMALLGLMILGNAICFVLVIRQLTCGRSTVAKDHDRRQDVIRYLAISVLLGLTWAFGFLAIGGAQFIFNLLFLIFNSLQGFFIFFFFCLRQEEVRNIWYHWLRHPCTSRDYQPGKQKNTSTDNRSSTDTKSNKKTGSTAANSESIQMVNNGENGNNTEHT